MIVARFMLTEKFLNRKSRAVLRLCLFHYIFLLSRYYFFNTAIMSENFFFLITNQMISVYLAMDVIFIKDDDIIVFGGKDRHREDADYKKEAYRQCNNSVFHLRFLDFFCFNLNYQDKKPRQHAA